MSDATLIRVGSSLRAADDTAQREINRIADGEEVRVRFIRTRSLGQLRYYWALCNLIAQQHSSIQNKEQADQALRILAGHTDPLVDPSTGEIMALLPKRISFEKLGQADWEDYLRRAKDVAISRLLPGVTSQQLEQEILSMVQ